MNARCKPAFDFDGELRAIAMCKALDDCPHLDESLYRLRGYTRIASMTVGDVKTHDAEALRRQQIRRLILQIPAPILPGDAGQLAGVSAPALFSCGNLEHRVYRLGQKP